MTVANQEQGKRGVLPEEAFYLNFLRFFGRGFVEG
jgi:hypothetical protein